MLRSEDWWLVTDVSEHLIGPVFKRQGSVLLGLRTLEDGTDRFYRNVGNYQSMLRNVLEERSSHLHRGGSLKSPIVNIFNVAVLEK